MKRHSLILVAAVGLVAVLSLGNARANGPMGKPQGTTPRVSPPVTHPGQGRRPVPPVTHTPPRDHPPVHGNLPRPPAGYTPPHIRPPVRVAPPAAPVPATFAGVGGGVLTRGAWVGYNSLTGRYSVAFDSPDMGGVGILIKAGYDVIVLGPTTWTGAVSYLKSVGAPGW